MLANANTELEVYKLDLYEFQQSINLISIGSFNDDERKQFGTFLTKLYHDGDGKRAIDFLYSLVFEIEKKCIKFTLSQVMEFLIESLKHDVPVDGVNAYLVPRLKGRYVYEISAKGMMMLYRRANPYLDSLEVACVTRDRYEQCKEKGIKSASEYFDEIARNPVLDMKKFTLPEVLFVIVRATFCDETQPKFAAYRIDELTITNQGDAWLRHPKQMLAKTAKKKFCRENL